MLGRLRPHNMHAPRSPSRAGEFTLRLPAPYDADLPLGSRGRRAPHALTSSCRRLGAVRQTSPGFLARSPTWWPSESVSWWPPGRLG